MITITSLHEYVQPQGTVVAISGCFDIIHIGHIRFIEAVKKYGDKVVMLLESDEFIKIHKKREPFHTQDERAEIMGHIRGIDCVVKLPLMSSEEAYRDMWERIKPSVIAITQGDPYVEKKRQQAEGIGAKLVEAAPLIEGKSTTNLLKRIQMLEL